MSGLVIGTACRLAATWRTGFALGIIVIVFIIYWRVFRLRESAVWAAARKKERDQLRETMLLFQHFWHRCVVLCSCLGQNLRYVSAST